MPSSALWKKAQYWRADVGIGPYMGFQLVREHPKAAFGEGGTA